MFSTFRGKKIINSAKISVLAIMLALPVILTGCGQKKVEVVKPDGRENTTSEMNVTHENMNVANGKSDSGLDDPLVIAVKELDEKVNPFTDQNDGGMMALTATQVHLLTFDRDDQVVENALEGEKRTYNGNKYTYHGPADIKVSFNRTMDTTKYDIKLGKYLTFSDGSELNADDVIFSLYAFADTDYEGPFSLAHSSIVGLKLYNEGNKDYIRGIKRLSKYELVITTEGYDRKFIHNINIPILSMNYYGKRSLIDPENNGFGVKKGVVSELKNEEKTLFGAGPYRYVKTEQGSMYFEANQNYFRGVPVSAFLELKPVGEKEAFDLAEGINQGAYDVVYADGSYTAVKQAAGRNPGGLVNGSTLFTRFYDAENYWTVCLNGVNVSVNKTFDSERSINLRKGICTLIAADRANIIDNFYSFSRKKIDYPTSFTGPDHPLPDQKGFKEAYSTGPDGKAVYGRKELESDARYESARQTAIRYFEKAGFEFNENGHIKNVEGLPGYINFGISLDDDDGGAVYRIFSKASLILNDMGFNTEVSYLKDKKLKKMRKKHKLDIWLEDFDTDPDPDLYKKYYGSYDMDENYFSMVNGDINEYLSENRYQTDPEKKAEINNKIYGLVMDEAVEVPLFQERDMILFSSRRVDQKSVAADITPYYNWTEELYLVQTK
jgi:ABC-type transport system substrate-binding protein